MTNKRSIRVLLADDHAVVRQGFRMILSSQAGIEVVGEAGNGREAVELAGKLHPDVAVIDVSMPELNGIEATRRITALPRGPRVLVLTSFAADDKVFPAIKAGALGYLLKDSGPNELVRAIRQVHRGEPSPEENAIQGSQGLEEGPPMPPMPGETPEEPEAMEEEDLSELGDLTGLEV